MTRAAAGAAGLVATAFATGCGGGSGAAVGDVVQSVELVCDASVNGQVTEFAGDVCNTVGPLFLVPGGAATTYLGSTYYNVHFDVTVRQPSGATYAATVTPSPRQSLRDGYSTDISPGDRWPRP